MRNLWIQTEMEFVAWSADIAALLPTPDALLELLRKLRALGTEHEVFALGAAAEPPLGAGWRDRREIDADLSGFGIPRARMAWYDRNDRLVEGMVEDLGEVLRSLQPQPDLFPRGYMELGWAPLQVSGVKYRYSDVAPVRSHMIHTIGFSIYSDIWFPFVVGSPHPAHDYIRYFDNRELAMRHTPRLNRFLADARAAVIDAGATWDDEPEVVKTMKRWVGPHGISLDGPVPNLFPADVVSGDWWKWWLD